MKRLIVIALLLMMGGMVRAQDVVRDSVAVDTTDTEENVIGAKPQPKKSGEKKEPNVLGAPVYYDIYGNVEGSSNASSIYHRPKHHYLNNLNERYYTFFLEGELLTGRHDHALGASFTYLPKRWGFYTSVLAGVHHTYLSMGAALRLSGYESSLDWQLYGGVGGGGHHLGGEAGLRMAFRRNHGEFCWTSLSAGYANYGGYGFLTFGASLELMAVSAIPAFIFL